MIFRFVVRKLKWLARIPLLPHVFDSFLLIAAILFDRPRLRAREIFEQAISRREEIHFAPHRFGGIGFFVERNEIGHLHGNGLLDLLVGKPARTDLINKGLAMPHHVLPDSGWISFWLSRPSEACHALELFELARVHCVKGESVN